MVVVIEIMTMYIMLIYLNEMDRYSTMVLIGVGMCMIIRSGNRWVSLMMLVMIWPMFYRYMEWVSMWITRAKIREFYKKMVVILLVISLVVISVELMYMVVLSVGVYGIGGVIALGVYGWIILGVRMTLLILTYLTGNILIELNWKLLIVRVLPLPAFFIKIIGRWMLIYAVIYLGILVIVNSNR